MSRPTFSLWIFFVISFVVALGLAVFPLPFDLQWWRPEFVLLLVIYWVYTLHSHISLIAICAIGLFQDILERVPFGQHGLSVIVVAYLCLLSYQRVRTFSWFKQCAWVFVLVGLAQLLDNWVQGMAGRELSGLNFLYPAIASALIWPLVRIWLDKVSMRHKMMVD